MADPFNLFVEYVGWLDPVMDPQASEVHKIPLGVIQQALDPAGVDKMLYEFLLTIGGSKGERVLVPVGWNVGSFDMPFVRNTLPLSAALFSRRYVDLNSVCFTYGSLVKGVPFGDWHGFKNDCKQFAEEALQIDGEPAQWHDAGYDAQAACYSWKRLRQYVSADVVREVRAA